MLRRAHISRLHADLREARLQGRGATEHEAQARTHKEYPRMPRITLPESSLFSTLDDAFDKRRSAQQAGDQKPLTLKSLSALLRGVRVQDDGHRPYPSGGALYPVETYLVGAIENYPADVFHYHPTAHALEHLWPLPEWFFGMRDLFPEGSSPAGRASAAIIFAAKWERSAVKYGDFAYMLSLLEAGHMAQNVLLAAAAIDVPARPMEGFEDGAAHRLLDLSGDDEQAVYSIALFAPNV